MIFRFDVSYRCYIVRDVEHGLAGRGATAEAASRKVYAVNRNTSTLSLSFEDPLYAILYFEVVNYGNSFNSSRLHLP